MGKQGVYRRIKRLLKVRTNQADKLVAGAIWGLNPNRKYLIGVDARLFTRDDAYSLAQRLDEMGVINVVATFHGDPQQALKIIKAKKKSNKIATSDPKRKANT